MELATTTTTTTVADDATLSGTATTNLPTGAGTALASDSASTSRVEQLVDELVRHFLDELDQRDFTGDDFIVMAGRVQELVLLQHAQLSEVQQKTLVLKVLRRIADHVLPKIDDEAGRTMIGLLLLTSGTLFDVLRAAFLRKFDVNGDGDVTAEEFNAVCAGCCCAPRAVTGSSSAN